MGASDLRVWSYGKCEFVIAADKLDAARVLAEHWGDEVYDVDINRKHLSVMPNAEEMTIWCGSSGDPAEPDGTDCTPVTKTCAEWAKRGRSYLCTTEA